MEQFVQQIQQPSHWLEASTYHLSPSFNPAPHTYLYSSGSWLQREISGKFLGYVRWTGSTQGESLYPTRLRSRCSWGQHKHHFSQTKPKPSTVNSSHKILSIDHFHNWGSSLQESYRCQRKCCSQKLLRYFSADSHNGTCSCSHFILGCPLPAWYVCSQQKPHEVSLRLLKLDSALWTLAHKITLWNTKQISFFFFLSLVICLPREYASCVEQNVQKR